MAFTAHKPARHPLFHPEGRGCDDACSGFTHVTDRTVAPAPLRTRPLDHARGHSYQASRHLPGPDSHRPAVLNLSLDLRHDELHLLTTPKQSGRTRATASAQGRSARSLSFLHFSRRREWLRGCRFAVARAGVRGNAGGRHPKIALLARGRNERPLARPVSPEIIRSDPHRLSRSGLCFVRGRHRAPGGRQHLAPSPEAEQCAKESCTWVRRVVRDDHAEREGEVARAAVAADHRLRRDHSGAPLRPDNRVRLGHRPCDPSA
jgi:hypothetical protein